MSVDNRPERAVNWLWLATALAIAFMASATWVAMQRVTAEHRRGIEDALETVLQTTHQAISSWAGDQRAATEVWASDVELRRLTEQLLTVSPTSGALAGTPEQERIRARLAPFLEAFHYRGYFIIGTNDVNLSSNRDANIGVTNLLDGQGDFLDRMWGGESVLTLPQRSDVPLPDSAGALQEGRPTMFVGAPIRGSDGTIIALLTFRIDPAHDFTAIFHRGRIGLTGETYAFDRSGRLLTDSRFDDALRSLGLVGAESDALLNLEVRDPGANLVAGEAPVGDRPLTVMAASAVAGNDGRDALGYRDYRGMPVTGAWLWDEDLDFGITSEQDYEEAWRANLWSQRIVLMLGLFATGLMLLLSPMYVQSRKRAVRASMADRATRMNEELERRVVASTRELRASNAELEGAKHAAEAANRAKGAFLASMSHEIGTPLHAILGNAQLLGFDETLSAEHRRCAHAIAAGGERLSGLLSGLMSLAKAEGGDIHITGDELPQDTTLDVGGDAGVPLVTPDEARTIPQEIAGRIIRASVALDHEEIIAAIDELAADDPGLAARLRQIAGEYDYEILLQLLGSEDDG